MSEEIEKFVTKDYLAVVIGRLENKIDRLENKIDAKFNGIDTKFNGIDARFNAIDAKFNAQRLLAWATIAAIIAQIVNAWMIHLK
jgi:hypothetical protein